MAERMLTIHEHFRLNDGDETCLLAERCCASQSMCIGVNATPTWNTVSDGDDCAPFGKPGAHANVFSQAVAQSIQAFGHSFTGMRCQFLGAGIHLDSRNDPCVDEDLDERSAVALLLTDRLVEEDRAADALS